MQTPGHLCCRPSDKKDPLLSLLCSRHFPASCKLNSPPFSSLRNRPVRCRRDQTAGRRSPKILFLIFCPNIVFLREIWDQFIFWGPPGYYRQCKHKLPEDKDESLGMKLPLWDLVRTSGF